MINKQNYYSEIKKIDFNKLDASLRESKDFIDEITQNGNSWDMVYADDDIKEMVNLYFERLGQVASPKLKTNKPVVKQSVKAKGKVSASPKPKKKTSRQIAYEKANKVEVLSVELKMIKRFILMHDKLKNQNQIRLFINALQKAIVEKRIRKTSDYAKEIKEIQNFLIKLYGRFENANEKVHVQIGETKRSHYLTLIGKQAELISVKFIKSYINLQGKSITNGQAK